jgi:hypothetical protein
MMEADLAEEEARVDGLRGLSGLFGLQHFDFLTRFVPEYMHGMQIK